MEKVGALWNHVAKTSGKQFITGILDKNKMPPGDKVSIIVFQNTKKQSEKSPDYLIFLSEKVEQGGQTSGDLFSSPGANHPYGNDDDIPF